MTVPGCRLSPNRADLSSLILGLSVQTAYIDRARRRRFSRKIAGHTSILWMTGRVIGAIGVFGTDLSIDTKKAWSISPREAQDASRISPVRAKAKRAAVYPPKGVFRTCFWRRQAVCFLLQVAVYREVFRVRSVEQQVPID
jgi:hypothetical protein